MNSSGVKHSPLSIDDESSVIVADIEGLEELGGDNYEVYSQRQNQTLKRCPSPKHFLERESFGEMITSKVRTEVSFGQEWWSRV